MSIPLSTLDIQLSQFSHEQQPRSPHKRQSSNNFDKFLKFPNINITSSVKSQNEDEKKEEEFQGDQEDLIEVYKQNMRLTEDVTTRTSSRF